MLETVINVFYLSSKSTLWYLICDTTLVFFSFLFFFFLHFSFIVNIRLSSISRECWRDAIEENGLSPHPLILMYCVFGKYYCHMLCQWCGSMKIFGGAVSSHGPRMLFSVLTAFLVPFQYGDCMFLASHPQLLSDSLCMSAYQS